MPDPVRRAACLLGILAMLAAGPAAANAELPAQGTVELAFSPWSDPEGAVLRVIAAARESVHVQAYAFTSRRIANALVEAHRRGVRVAVLADAEMNSRKANRALASLLAAGVPLAFETAYAAAHNKVLIADPDGPGCAVVTGSYNFTWSAKNRNAENLLVLRDNCALAQAYLENWERHRAEATPITALPWKP